MQLSCVCVDDDSPRVQFCNFGRALRRDTVDYPRLADELRAMYM